MLDILLILPVAVSAGFFHWLLRRKLQRRIHDLEQDLHGISEVVTQLAEFQMKAYERFSTDFEDLEERFMDLRISSHDSNHPLERRHKVLALARQGIGLDEIVKRLKAPVGEAELILNLNKYRAEDPSRAARKNGQVRSHAQI